MAYVRVEQRNARLAAPVRVDTVSGRDGPITRGTVIVISNVRRGSGEGREEEATSILWTLWGKQADNAAEYLGKGSRVNVIGRLQNNNYSDAQGATVYGLTFTCEEIDYLDSKAEAEARRSAPVKDATRVDRQGAKGPLAHGDSDVPF
jgi:single-strand DNA-binding protein